MHTLYSGRAHGKLLLTAEYLVLDGARAIALPSKYGQSMFVTGSNSKENKLICRSFDEQSLLWFEGEFDLNSFQIIRSNDPKVAERFASLIKYISEKKPSHFSDAGEILIENKIDFNRQWGLGTSSTLIHNLATWSGLDPYDMLEQSFGGSGYDLACAAAEGPILYKRDSPAPRFRSIEFKPIFSDQIYFVYLGKKQNSREGIRNYREQQLESKITHAIAEVEELNDNILGATSLSDFEERVEEHESIISNIIGLPKVKDLYFKDLEGTAKSLGAWGGDFALLTYQGELEDLKTFCQQKGFDVVIPYKEMIL